MFLAGTPLPSSIPTATRVSSPALVCRKVVLKALPLPDMQWSSKIPQALRSKGRRNDVAWFCPSAAYCRTSSTCSGLQESWWQDIWLHLFVPGSESHRSLQLASSSNKANLLEGDPWIVGASMGLCYYTRRALRFVWAEEGFMAPEVTFGQRPKNRFTPSPKALALLRWFDVVWLLGLNRMCSLIYPNE